MMKDLQLYIPTEREQVEMALADRPAPRGKYAPVRASAPPTADRPYGQLPKKRQGDTLQNFLDRHRK